jgi:hypothetical protein
MSSGGGRQVLVQENGVVPYAMTYFADLLYFANWPTKTIEVVNATTGLNRTVLHDFLPEITNLVVAHGQKQKGAFFGGFKSEVGVGDLGEGAHPPPPDGFATLGSWFGGGKA